MMLWSLTKVILFVVLIAAFAFGAAFLSETGEAMRIVVAGWEFTIGPIQAVVLNLLLFIAVWLVLKVFGLLAATFRFLNGDETVKYKRAMLELLASYMFPYVGFEELRTCCDFINMITSLDDFSDLQDGDGAQQSTDTFLAAISGKPAKVTDLYRMVSQ